MKKSIFFLSVILLLAGTTGCHNKGQKKVEDKSPVDTSTVADTGYTGIKQYLSGRFVSYEATFKNGVKQGLMRTFYPSGKVRTSFWYENGMREDTAIWYYEDGTTIFRKTPFKRDSMNGVQIQYYKSGAVRTKMEFVDGLRKPYIEEFTSDGSKITDYPDMVVKTKDEYKLNGTYKINLELNKPDVKVTFYRGEYIDGLFAPKKYSVLNIKGTGTDGKVKLSDYSGFLQLKKSATGGESSVGIIAEISTKLGNKFLVYRKIELPYNDLK
jgi:hypothetical protein